MAYRIDGNQPAIIAGLKQARIRVLSTAKIGAGTPDVVGYCPMTNVFALLEIKMPSERLRLKKSQISWRIAHPEMLNYVYTVDSVEIALKVFKVIP